MPEEKKVEIDEKTLQDLLKIGVSTPIVFDHIERRLDSLKTVPEDVAILKVKVGHNENMMSEIRSEIIEIRNEQRREHEARKKDQEQTQLWRKHEAAKKADVEKAKFEVSKSVWGFWTAVATAVISAITAIVLALWKT